MEFGAIVEGLDVIEDGGAGLGAGGEAMMIEQFVFEAALDCEGRTIWIVDAHRDDGKRFVVHADEKLTAFLELEGDLYPPMD